MPGCRFTLMRQFLDEQWARYRDIRVAPTVINISRIIICPFFRHPVISSHQKSDIRGPRKRLSWQFNVRTFSQQEREVIAGGRG